MYKLNRYLLSTLIVIALLAIPLFTAWWMFFPLALGVAFFLSKPLEAIIAGFILDLVYFGGIERGWPWLTTFVVAIYVIKAIFRDKLRF